MTGTQRVLNQYCLAVDESHNSDEVEAEHWAEEARSFARRLIGRRVRLRTGDVGAIVSLDGERVVIDTASGHLVGDAMDMAAADDMTGKWSFSTDEENYHGEFDTLEAAIAKAREGVEEGATVWVAQQVPPVQPEELFTHYSVEEWLERDVLEHEDYLGPWAEGAVPATREQLKELAADIKPIIAAWFDRHNLRPTHFVIDDKSVRRIEADS